MDESFDVYSSMEKIGIAIKASRRMEAIASKDIEQILLIIAMKLFSGDDPKILAPVLSWLLVHGERVNMERLAKLKKEEDPEKCAWLSLFASFGYHQGQTRWKLLLQKPKILHANGPIKLAKALVKRSGEEEWAKESGFLIPKGSEPIDKKYVLSPQQLAEINPLYRNRLIFGTSWRADIVTAIENGAQSPTEVAKASGSSYEPAYRVFNELKTARWPNIA